MTLADTCVLVRRKDSKRRGQEHRLLQVSTLTDRRTVGWCEPTMPCGPLDPGGKGKNKQLEQVDLKHGEVSPPLRSESLAWDKSTMIGGSSIQNVVDAGQGSNQQRPPARVPALLPSCLNSAMHLPHRADTSPYGLITTGKVRHDHPLLNKCVLSTSRPPSVTKKEEYLSRHVGTRVACGGVQRRESQGWPELQAQLLNFLHNRLTTLTQQIVVEHHFHKSSHRNTTARESIRRQQLYRTNPSRPLLQRSSRSHGQQLFESGRPQACIIAIQTTKCQA